MQFLQERFSPPAKRIGPRGCEGLSKYIVRAAEKPATGTTRDQLVQREKTPYNSDAKSQRSMQKKIIVKNQYIIRHYMKKYIASSALALFSFTAVAFAQTPPLTPPAPAPAPAPATSGIGTEVSQANRQAEQQIQALRKQMEAEIKAIREKYQAQIDSIRKAVQSTIQQIKDTHKKAAEDARQKKQDEMKKRQDEMKQKRDDMKQKIEDMKNQMKQENKAPTSPTTPVQ